MRKILTVLIFFAFYQLSFGATGWFQDYIVVDGNYYWVGGNPGAHTQFDGHNFGTVTSLNITGADFKYWSDNQDRTGGAFYWQIQDAFDNVVKTSTEVIWSQSYSGGNNYQGTWSGSIDMLDGLAANTTYKLVIYAKHWGSSQGDNFLSNGGTNYKATFTTDPALPVELTTFSASIIENKVKLNWETATEVNNYGFDIERASSPLSKGKWEKVAFVNGHGNSNSPKTYSYSDNEVLSGTYQYRLKQIDFDGKYEYSDAVEINFGTPAKLELNQNYPNPFNPTTNIKFSLPNSSQVTLKVFNAIGQEVASLLNKKLNAGIHSVNFDASEFKSGVYFYQLTTDTKSFIKKMLLVK